MRIYERIYEDIGGMARPGRPPRRLVPAYTTGFFVAPAVAGFALDAGAGTALFVGLLAACGLAALGSLRLERHLPARANLI